ncbi:MULTISPECIES: aromatic-ring-hydroxylating dioxygenase subunit beta [Brevundimonas]|uniref:Aromatic-ring-hydroxylating dioxygenase, beta subunit n=1 Tax=Brevundimonas abyssalis TAR-001 TaxID=1391729 RepID=A0A8E0NB89_9CAUL|nr:MULTISPECIES: aromatic-ring-hydroxylating dioxygenase subunit beta [Brevundimonas]GAD58635.1 aromatic-ring-hydroxylating dioxygenase, beta subunit [Brevundimonas abyssalis TAR-001]
MSAADIDLLHRVTAFIYREAKLQDEHQYDDWEALWTDDGVYWIPANGDDIDPEKEMSIIFDNRSRIALRIRQFHTGKRHAQSPRSRLRRVVSNIEIAESSETGIRAFSNALIFESTVRADTVWSTRNEYFLRPEGETFRMARKNVFLTNNDRALFTLSFLV